MTDQPPIPATWVIARLDDVCAVNQRAFSPIHSAYDLPVHFVPMAAVEPEYGGIDIRAVRPMGEVTKGYTAFVQDDVLFAKITPCMENGKVALVPRLANHIGFGSTELHVLRAGHAVAPEWIARYLSQLSFRRLARQDMSGSAGQLRVQTGWLAAATVPIAPLAEQQRILRRVAELLSDADTGMAELLVAKRKLTLYRQSLLKSAVEGSLTADWRAEQGRSSSAASEKGGDWQTLAICEIGTVQLGRQRSPDKVGRANPTPYIRAANITENGVDLSDVLSMDFSTSEIATFALQPGDVLLTEASGSAEHVGRPAIWPRVAGTYCFQNTVVRFRPKSVSSEFAYFLFLALQKLGVFAQLSAGVGINHLSAGKFGKLNVAVPPTDEQDEIVVRLNRAFETIQEQEQAISWAVSRAAAQRQNILRAAFSGQLVPQDPNDEPASVLLDRIRAQRSAAGNQATPRRPRKSKLAHD